MNMKMNIENEEEQRPTAPPAAYAPMQGARGGMAALSSALDKWRQGRGNGSSTTEIFEQHKAPAWAAADAAPPDAVREDDKL